MITQAKETYTWVAICADDSFIGEYDRPDARGFAEVDGLQVKQLKLESSNPHLRSHYVEIPQGTTPVFFRRRRIEINPLNGQERGRSTVHCIGWKLDNTAVYLFVFDDGSTLLTDNLQAV